MEWSEWSPFYRDIIERLEIDSNGDYEATAILSRLLIDTDPEPLITSLEKRINGKKVVVFGSGPSLEEHIDTVQKDPSFSEAVFIAADGATTALRENGLRCDFIVTDLDGNLDDILSSMNDGAISIVHSHGDNISAINKYVPKMERVLGSTQVEPLPNVFLWGGFTDGDRACFLASHYRPRSIVLAGMDFGEIVGRWSKPGNTENFPATHRKLIKMDIAQSLLRYLWSAKGIAYTELKRERNVQRDKSRLPKKD
ncbi:MAG: DUF115 domain-containing protein [Candidatus Thorarchaeota archaeon]|nr:DUF115 domain-containing protein [Candidatus Thorarchaeota archaeon]